MTETNRVRPSRDGDQFHYLWAARRCLPLLSPQNSLKAITIEGSSPSETAPVDRVTAGEELIDIGEYYGSEELESATLIRYLQLKHSTLRADEAWTPSGLEKTLRGFSDRYKALQQLLQTQELTGKLEFSFVSNRPIDSDFLEAVHDAAQGVTARHVDDLKKLESFTGLRGPALSAFCKLLRLEGSHDGLWDQRNMLAQDVKYYLPDEDVDAPVQLKELVTRKALSESAGNPRITRVDVLRALKTDESRLFPAPCLITDLESAISRAQEPELVHSIVLACATPVIVHADSGVGKSVFARRIKRWLPAGSLDVVYDCFGNGQYRSASGYRHRHKDALVQIANELAAKGLCHPLIPTPHAEPPGYVRAFLHRLRQSVTSLKANDAQALLCIIIDAADNAQMAAEEIGEARSFARDLLRERLPEGVRLVVLCRTHRQHLLDPPPSAIRLKLLAFNRAETAACLRRAFPQATDRDIDEFHRLSSHNPRVQALALAQKASLNEILRALGPNPKTVDDAIGNLLKDAIAKLRDAVGSIEKDQVDRICAGLAALRPLIPLSVLASMSGVSEAAIRSFALDLGRPLLVTDNTIQFLDEPAETWFRERFRPTAGDLVGFVASLKPLATRSAYVASALPQLMLEAGQFAELVTLALSSEALPNTNPVEKRDVQLQRLQFALKASLRAKRYVDAAKLALKAGGESAGDERQRKLLQANTDLAAVFMEGDRIEELVSRRTFGSGWVGSHHAYEAALLSGRRELLGDARSRLRMAQEWLQNWSELPQDERRQEQVTDNDILQMVMAFFNIHGAVSCARHLRGWRPREVSFRVGRTLASRLIDQDRYSDLDGLALAAGNDLCLILAITVELRQVHRAPPRAVIERAVRLALNSRVDLRGGGGWNSETNAIVPVTALVEGAHRLSVGTTDELISLLTRYLPDSPPRGLASRHSGTRSPLLRAYALRAALNGQPLNLIDLADAELRKELENPKPHSESRDAQEFKEDIGALLPWESLWAAIFVGRTSPVDLASAIAETLAVSSKAEKIRYREESYTSDEIARTWFDTLLASGNVGAECVKVFNQWIAGLKRPLFTTTLTHLARLAARSPSLEARSLEYAAEAFRLTRDVREDAESKSDSYVGLARAVLTASRSDSAAYFNEAVEVASKIGSENLDRWDALLDLAGRAASRDRPVPLIAYRLARCAELTYDYVVRDKHFAWKATVEAIAGLCGSSSVAILSRWRDRAFGWAPRILPIAVNFLVARGDLHPKIALALTAFRAQWDAPFLLKNVLDTCASRAEKDVAVEFCARYMALDRHSAETWRELKGVLAQHAIGVDGLDQRIALSEQEEQSARRKDTRDVVDRPAVSERDWNVIFEGVDLRAANDISRAYRRFMSSEPPFYHERFFEEACQLVNVGGEAEFIAALADVADLDLYHLRTFLEKLPIAWRGRLAIKTALAKTVRAFCRRHCMAITKSRYYQVLPLKTACELSGIPEGEIIDVVLSAVGEATEVIGAGRLFTLVGLLAVKLSKDEALEALSFGLDLFDSVLGDADGDGPWTPTLAPPAEVEGSIAGYIWAALAAPRASLRWEAAHVVRALCTLRRGKVLSHLVTLANGAPINAFADGRLHFYQLHACQWLVVGLARAAKDDPDIVAPHADFLFKTTFSAEPHVLIREFARRAFQALVDSGRIACPADLRLRLATVNTSSFQPVESKSYRRCEDAKQEEETHGEQDSDRFYFGIDMGPYWLAPLGRCFAKSQSQIEREALRVIRSDWNFSRGSRWDEDERYRRKIFRNGETMHSHSSSPRVDDLRFYLSYHAMMVVAGKLLATTPVHRDTDDPEDEFHNWLRGHELTRADAGWLADRRDPAPIERPGWMDEKESDEWRWSIARSDFDQILMGADSRMNLCGYWTKRLARREESIHVSSALVSPARSAALLRALHCTSNPHDYRIPDADDDLQIDVDGFQLKGWLINRTHSSGLDEHDPWAGAIRYPPPAPAAFVTDLMNLDSDSERRGWHVKGDHACIAWSQVWGHFQEKDDDENGDESGSRFQASFEFMLALLRQLRMDLIVKVEIERHRRYSRWESRNDDDFGFILPSARLFLLRSSDGSLSTL